MKFIRLLVLLSFLFATGCYNNLVVKEGFNFSDVKTVSVVPIRDYENFLGSGEIISRSLVHHLMKLGLNVVEREKLYTVIEEAALSQTAITDADYTLEIESPDAIILCTITEFSDKQVIVIPITTHDKGRTVTTIEEKREPIIKKDNDDEDSDIAYTTTTVEETTHFKGSIIETSRVEYVNSVVGITLQMIRKETGEILWSSNYWYNSLSLSNAVDKCVSGAIKPLKKIYLK
ncbi:MAG: hypothetical protein IIB44_11040 [Candidatus Marinimicrobia bacterium]|nr:hypothetical protein [Candidatus Neomarinimicrobiota bacterium]